MIKEIIIKTVISLIFMAIFYLMYKIVGFESSLFSAIGIIICNQLFIKGDIDDNN